MKRSPVLMLLAIVAATFALPSVASAHAEYKSSVPAKGAVVTAAPSQVEIIFTEDIQKVAGAYDIQVDRDRGAAVTTGPAVIDESNRARMTVQLEPNLAPGRYVVQWKNVSDEDGDPKEGAFSFYVNTQPTAVDLQNDQQLASIGAEAETPGAATPTAAAVGPATAPAPTTGAPTAGGTTAAVPTATPSSGGGGSNTTVYVIVGVLAAAAVATAGAWWAFARRRA